MVVGRLGPVPARNTILDRHDGFASRRAFKPGVLARHEVGYKKIEEKDPEMAFFDRFLPVLKEAKREDLYLELLEEKISRLEKNGRRKEATALSEEVYEIAARQADAAMLKLMEAKNSLAVAYRTIGEDKKADPLFSGVLYFSSFAFKDPGIRERFDGLTGAAAENMIQIRHGDRERLRALEIPEPALSHVWKRLRRAYQDVGLPFEYDESDFEDDWRDEDPEDDAATGETAAGEAANE